MLRLYKSVASLRCFRAAPTGAGELETLRSRPPCLLCKARDGPRNGTGGVLSKFVSIVPAFLRV